MLWIFLNWFNLQNSIMFVVYLNINCLKEKKIMYFELKVKYYNWIVFLEWKEKFIMFEEGKLK